jgi:hypothetical protein
MLRVGSLLCLLVFPVLADQPIFNEMPRWSDGWGFQWVHEYRHNRDLLTEETKVGGGFTEDVHILHLEGVYTWKKSIRMTAKVPYVLDARREMLGPGGGKLAQHDEGLGDITLALPLKKYFNLDGRSGSWTLAPQLRIPIANDDAYAVYDHNWGNGLSLGYETETFQWHLGAAITGWVFYEGDEAELSATLDLGRNLTAFGSSGHVKWETDLIHEDDGTVVISAGPALYWKITDTVHTRIDWKRDWFDRQGGIDHGNGDTFKVGIGFVF